MHEKHLSKIDQQEYQVKLLEKEIKAGIEKEHYEALPNLNDEV